MDKIKQAKRALCAVVNFSMGIESVSVYCDVPVINHNEYKTPKKITRDPVMRDGMPLKRKKGRR